MALYRSRRFRAKVGQSPHPLVAWTLTITQLTTALRTALILKFVTLGELVFQMRGRAIGGVISKAAVSLFLGYLEELYFDSISNSPIGSHYQFRRLVASLRYVDDGLFLSGHFCGCCLEAHVRAMYHGLSLSIQSSHECLPWLGVEVRVHSSLGYWITLLNHNRPWLLDPHATRKLHAIMEYLGRPPQPFAHTVAYLTGRVVRMSMLDLSVHSMFVRLMEDVCELILRRYPFSYMRAITHRLSRRFPAVLRLQGCVRLIYRFLAPHGRAAMVRNIPGRSTAPASSATATI